MPGVAHDQFGDPDPARQIARAREEPRQHQGLGGVLHRMEIEEVVGGVDNRAQHAGAFELGREA